MRIPIGDTWVSGLFTQKVVGQWMWVIHDILARGIVHLDLTLEDFGQSLAWTLNSFQ